MAVDNSHASNLFKRYRILIICAIQLLLLLSAGFSLEIFLRIKVKDAYLLDSGLTYDRHRNATYYKRLFLNTVASKKNLSNKSYDPLLGWDKNIDDGRVRGKSINSSYQFDANSKYKIIAIGDSFTFGNGVGADQSYPSYLEKKLTKVAPTEVLNMGVGGYGIDQAIIKYLNYGANYEPNIVVLGIHTGDYERAGVSFFSYYKPYYEINAQTNKVELIKPYIPPPTEGLLQVQNEVGTYSTFTYPYLRNRLLNFYWNRFDKDLKPRYYREMDTIVSYALTNLQASLDKTKTKLIVVYIPLGESFKDQQHWEDAKKDENYQHIKQILQNLNIDYIDLLSEFPKRYNYKYISNMIYLDNGNEKGHFTSKGNRFVAFMLKNTIKNINNSNNGDMGN